MIRPRIDDVAREAGVPKTAVSVIAMSSSSGSSRRYHRE